MAELDWCNLPIDLLHRISQLFDNEIDLIRFRSVCSTWRTTLNHCNILPFNFPLLDSLDCKNLDPKNLVSILNNVNTPLCSLSKRTHLLIKPPPQQQQQTLIRPWLIRIIQDSRDKTKLVNPLTKSPLPFRNSIHGINFNKHSVFRLGSDYLADKFTIPNQFDDYTNNYIYPKTVFSVTRHWRKPLVLATLSYNSGLPLLFRGSNGKWTIISNMSTQYGDICVFKERFYVVDKSGRTVIVRPDSSLEEAAQPLVYEGDRKLLVESDGKLLLVKLNYEYSHCFSDIDLFILDEKEKKWMKLMDLGDRVLFIGCGCSFSASASELCFPKGNCVIFIDYSVLPSNQIVNSNRIFHMDQGMLSHQSQYPEYFKCFSPPEWIFKI